MEIYPGQMPQQVGKAVAAYFSADFSLRIVLSRFDTVAFLAAAQE
ncbi:MULTISPECIES: hypothetical protein [Brucella/Ochrobactrum group]|nr:MULTISPECIES: hypothetical protein [Brucella/Ochrobactrum group]